MARSHHDDALLLERCGCCGDMFVDVNGDVNGVDVFVFCICCFGWYGIDDNSIPREIVR